MSGQTQQVQVERVDVQKFPVSKLKSELGLYLAEQLNIDTSKLLTECQRNHMKICNLFLRSEDQFEDALQALRNQLADRPDQEAVQAQIASLEETLSATQHQLRSTNEALRVERFEHMEFVKKIEEQLELKDDAIKKLTKEKEHCRQRIADLVAEAKLHRPKKSLLIPHPPILTDGKDPTLAVWVMKMRDKLVANADHIFDNVQEMAYVRSRCGGPSADILTKRSAIGSTAPYENTKDIIDHLVAFHKGRNHE